MRREHLPNRYEIETHKIKVGTQSWFVTKGFYPDGRLGEVGFKTAKAGSHFQEMMHFLGISMSLALQHGATSEEFVGIMRDTSESHVMQAVAGVLAGT